jgi:membrane-associated phospholipid phosphatase
VPLLLLVTVTALLATWAFRRYRRILADGPSSIPAGRPRAVLAEVGLNPLGRRLAACSAAVLAADILLFSIRGLTLDWASAWFGAVLLAALLAAWLNFYFLPGASDERFAGETVFIVLLIVFLTNVASPMQYGAVAIGAPYADPWLAAADAALGIHVPALAAWTAGHHAIALVAAFAYASLLPQFLFAVVALAFLRERERLWEFAFHFHVCLIVTVAALAIWPAICPPAYYGFASTIDMTRLMGQIKGFHDGTMTVVRFDELEGLVSFPSFHVAGALIVTWAFRHRRRFLIPLVVLNVALALSTFVSGVHYVVDVIAALPLCAGSLAAYRWWGRPLLLAASGSQAVVAELQV